MYYRIMGDSENYANLMPADYTMDFASQFDGRSLADGWKKIHFELIDPQDNRPLPEIATGYIPICSKRVYEVIKDMCKGCVEFLPCTVGAENLEYYIFNILDTRDVVDYSKSTFRRFSTTGRIMMFDKIVFVKEVTLPMFRIKDLPYTHFFCTEDMKKLLDTISVEGLVFSNELF